MPDGEIECPECDGAIGNLGCSTCVRMWIEALAKRCARLTVTLEAASKDAERYRWIRSPEAAVAEICNSATDIEIGFVFMEGAQLDAAIDTALAAGKEKA